MGRLIIRKLLDLEGNSLFIIYII